MPVDLRLRTAAVTLLATTIGSVVASLGAMALLQRDSIMPPDPGRLMAVSETDRDGRLQTRLLNSSVEALRSVPCFAQLTTYFVDGGLQGDVQGEEGREIRVAHVNRSFFSVFAPAFSQGRGFTSDDRPEGAIVVTSRLADAVSAGSSLRTRDATSGEVHGYAVVGVLRSRFGFPDGVDGWVLDSDALAPAGFRERSVIARVKAECSAESAAGQLQALYSRLRAETPSTYARSVYPHPVDWARFRRGAVRGVLEILVVAASAIFLAAVTGFGLVVRAWAQKNEPGLALRASLGATVPRLIWHSVAQWGWVAVSAGFGAYGVAWAVTKVLAASAAFGDAGLDLRNIETGVTATAIVTAGAAAAACLLGAGGVVRGLHARIPVLLGMCSGGVMTVRFGFSYKAMIAVQVASAVALMSAACSLTLAAFDVAEQPLGFGYRNLWVVRVSEPRRFYESKLVNYIEQNKIDPGSKVVSAGEVYDGIYRPLSSDLSGLPGVEGVALADGAFFGAEEPLRLTVRDASGSPAGEPAPGQTAAAAVPSEDEGGVEASVMSVGPGYLKVMRVPLLRGREFGPQDGPLGEQTAIVSRRFARSMGGESFVLGKRLKIKGFPGSWRVVGVAGDARYSGAAGLPDAIVYVPFYQRPLGFAGRRMLVRGAPGWSLRLSPFNDVVKAYGLSLYSRSEMVDLLSERLARVRFAMRLLWIAALVGVLSTLGSILGVLRYVVSTDRKNIAIRLALGAGLRQIFAAYVARTLAPVGVGAVAGVVLSGVSYAFVRQLVNVAPARAAWVVISLAVGVVVSALMLLLGVLAPVRRRPIHAVLGN